jgi:hypothetical protein
MKYHLTLINTDGFMVEETLDLPVDDTIQWEDFVQLRGVRECLLLHPTMKLIDVTPDGMPDWFSDEEKMTRQLANMGLRKSTTDRGAPQYEDIDQDDLTDSCD